MPKVKKRWIELRWSDGSRPSVSAEVFGKFCVHEVPFVLTFEGRELVHEYRVSSIKGYGSHHISDGLSHEDAVAIARRLNNDVTFTSDPDENRIAEAIFGEVLGEGLVS